MLNACYECSRPIAAELTYCKSCAGAPEEKTLQTPKPLTELETPHQPSMVQLRLFNPDDMIIAV